jgi:hypothetical protein
MSLQVVPLVKTNPYAWWAMPAFLGRVARFLQRYDTDSQYDQLAYRIQADFINAKPSSMAFVAVRDSVIVGHVLVLLEPWGSKLYANVFQYELDKTGRGRVPPDEIRSCWEQIQDWAREQGCVSFRILARSPAAARLFERYGFRVHRYLMDMPIAPVGDDELVVEGKPVENTIGAN